MPSWSIFIRILAERRCRSKGPYVSACLQGRCTACTDRACCSARERTSCALRYHLRTWDHAVLWPAEHIWSNLHRQMVPGSWTSPSSTVMPCGTAVCHTACWGCTHTRPLVQIRSCAFVPCIHPVPCSGRAASKRMDRLASRCDYSRRCTTMTNGNRAQETSAEAAWSETSLHHMFLCP